MSGWRRELLSCSECGAVGTYRRGSTSDVECSACGNEVDARDFQLDGDEYIAFNPSGYLCVYIPND